MSELNSIQGLSIPVTATHLRNFAFIERSRIRILAGWFIRLANYEHKYMLAEHLYDASEHVTWFRKRLTEMRGGNPNASVRPELKCFLEDVLHAPSDSDFLAGFYGVLTREILATVIAEIGKMDRCANANEVRFLEKMRITLETQMAWYSTLGIHEKESSWANHLAALLGSAGGLHGESTQNAVPAPIAIEKFRIPKTVILDSRITNTSLASYADRQAMTPREATIAQFHVFFNELYAAAFLATILFDAEGGDYPWEMTEDFSRHFWDESRHSQFGMIRLREFGVEPSQVNLILFDEAQDLPVLHRIAYLTRGLEAFYMPRKPKRMKEYEGYGDVRSQIFADQDWSDEITHVRYGSRWTDYLLENDQRDVDDVLDEVKAHLSKARGVVVTTVNSPF